MKKIFLLTLWLNLMSCTDEIPIIVGTENIFNKTDTTYNSSHEEYLSDQMWRDLGWEVPSLNEFETAIRIVCDGGWFNPDYVCSIYNTDPVRIQLVASRWDFKFVQERGPFEIFYFKEHLLSKAIFDSIYTELVEIGIQDMGMDLHSGYGCTDCDNLGILVKNKAYTKAIAWQYSEPKALGYNNREVKLAKKNSTRNTRICRISNTNGQC